MYKNCHDLTPNPTQQGRRYFFSISRRFRKSIINWLMLLSQLNLSTYFYSVIGFFDSAGLTKTARIIQSFIE